MAVIKSSKVALYALLCFCLVAITAARPPQNSIESQETPEQDNSNDIRRLYNAYTNYPGPNGPNGISAEERMALNRLQYEMMANFVQSRNPQFSSMPVGGGWNEQLYRTPEIVTNKRQVRYRQCYFNPISCFRK